MVRLDPSNLNWKGCRFLDPMGKVFEFEGEYYRAVYPHKVDYVRSLFSRGIIEHLSRKGLLIETAIAGLEVDGFGLVLKHRRIPFITHAGEWNRKFFQAAALCGIDLNLDLLPYGLGTIDFHCNNIQQQENCSPVWIDLGSICPLGEIGNGTAAMNEFKQYFMHPLHLLSQKQHLGRICRLLTSGGGISEHEFRDLANGSLNISTSNRKTLLESIRSWLSELKFPEMPRTQWDNYQAESYIIKLKPEKMDTRSKIVRQVIQDSNPQKVIDLSCNAGRFSFMAADMGAETYAVDLDEMALDTLYNLSKTFRKKMPVTVALRNLVYKQKHLVQGDVVLALALTHHLSLSQRYPFSYIAEILSSYCRNVLLTEFMPNGLGGTRPVPDPLPDGYTLANFIDAFKPHFRNIETIYRPIPPKHGFRILVRCSGLKSANDAEATRTTISLADYDDLNKGPSARMVIICPECNQFMETAGVANCSCPACRERIEIKPFSAGTHATGSSDTRSIAIRA